MESRNLGQLSLQALLLRELARPGSFLWLQPDLDKTADGQPHGFVSFFVSVAFCKSGRGLLARGNGALAFFGFIFEACSHSASIFSIKDDMDL